MTQRLKLEAIKFIIFKKRIWHRNAIQKLVGLRKPVPASSPRLMVLPFEIIAGIFDKLKITSPNCDLGIILRSLELNLKTFPTKL